MSSPSQHDIDPLLRQAEELSRQGQHQAARACLEGALLLEPPARQQGWALSALAHTHINAGDPGAAADCFERIIGLDGADPVCLCEAYAARGYQLMAARKYDAARAAFSQAVSVAGGHPSNRASAQFHLAKSSLAMGDSAGARAELETFFSMPNAFAGELQQAQQMREQLAAKG